MNKAELIKKVAADAGHTQKVVGEVLEAVMGTIVEALAEGDKVALVGFGTFEVSERAARQGRNPQTGETMMIAASKAPKFKAGKVFKDAVNA